MAHPDDALCGEILEQGIRALHIHGDRPVFPVAAVRHGAAEFAVEQLHAVTDAEHGAAE